jgi:hypothetical protein
MDLQGNDEEREGVVVKVVGGCDVEALKFVTLWSAKIKMLC